MISINKFGILKIVDEEDYEFITEKDAIQIWNEKEAVN